MLRKQNADAKLEKADIAEHDDQVKLNAPKHAFHKCSAEEKSECHARLEEANATFQRAQGSTQRAKEGSQDARKTVYGPFDPVSDEQEQFILDKIHHFCVPVDLVSRIKEYFINRYARQTNLRFTLEENVFTYQSNPR